MLESTSGTRSYIFSRSDECAVELFGGRRRRKSHVEPDDLGFVKHRSFEQCREIVIGVDEPRFVVEVNDCLDVRFNSSRRCDIVVSDVVGHLVANLGSQFLRKTSLST